MVDLKDVDISNITEDNIEEAEFFLPFIEGVMLVQGKKGSGKTMTSIMFAYKLRGLFRRRVVLDFRPFEVFGEYKFMDEKVFLHNLENVSKTTKQEEQESIYLSTLYSLGQMNIDLSSAVIVLDEAYKYFDAQRQMDKMVQVFSYFVAQSRHYKCLVVIIAPSKRWVTYRVRQQIDWTVSCVWDPYSRIVRGTIVHHLDGKIDPITVDPNNYGHMYDTHGAISLRSKILDVKGL